MKVAILGPICKDEIIIKGKKHLQVGGATYYIGNALASLGVETKVFGSFKDGGNWLSGFSCDIIHIPAEGTIKFVNEYPTDNPNFRVQKAEIHKNVIGSNSIPKVDPFDYIILGPLFNDNIGKDIIKALSTLNKKIVLAGQGMIRYLDGDKIIWKHPENIIEILGYIDYLAVDEQELKFISQKKSVDEAVGFLKGKGLKNLIVTDGINGSKLFFGDKSYTVKAFPPKKLVDPTGAGDSYLAGFIKAQELFDDPVKQGEFAAMTATIAIENKGPFNWSVDDVIRRLGW